MPWATNQVQLGATANSYYRKRLSLLWKRLGEPGTEVEKEGSLVGCDSSDLDGLRVGRKEQSLTPILTRAPPPDLAARLIPELAF